MGGDAAEGDWRPTATRASLEFRAAWLRRVREFFWTRGFIEVDTPSLSRDTVIDRHIDPIRVEADRVLGVAADPFWLQTSPEFGMKRLMSAGLSAIFQITRAYRGGERGGHHNPEFTILEWYRAADDYQRGMALLGEFAQEMFQADRVEAITYRDAFLGAADVDPFDCDAQLLRTVLANRGSDDRRSLDSLDKDACLDLLLDTIVQPNLGGSRPAILYDYPADQSALAQVAEREYGAVAERFELYVSGVELANGYHELLDPDELRRRNGANQRHRRAVGKDALPEESRLLSAMQHGLPPCAGVALGVDRAVMVAAGLQSLDEVTAFPIDIA